MRGERSSVQSLRSRDRIAAVPACFRWPRGAAVEAFPAPSARNLARVRFPPPPPQRQHSTKPGRMAGLRCLRDILLPEAHDEIALTLGRLLPPRLHQSRRVWEAGEQSVANRRDEL